MGKRKQPESENDVKKLVKQWYDKSSLYPKAWHYAPIQNGLGVVGIPDRIGCVPIKITPEMVGRVFGLFVAVESKKPGRRGEPDRGCSKHQAKNIKEINEAGGVAIVCDGELDLIDLTEKVFGSI